MRRLLVQNNSVLNEDEMVHNGKKHKTNSKKTIPCIARGGIHHVDSTASSNSFSTVSQSAPIGPSIKNLQKQTVPEYTNKMWETKGNENNRISRYPLFEEKPSNEFGKSRKEFEQTCSDVGTEQEMSREYTSTCTSNHEEVENDPPGPTQPSELDDVSQSTSTHRSQVGGSMATDEDISDSFMFHETKRPNSCFKPTEALSPRRGSAVSFSDQAQVRFFKPDVKRHNNRDAYQDPKQEKRNEDTCISTNHFFLVRSYENLNKNTRNGTQSKTSAKCYHKRLGHGDDLTVHDQYEEFASSTQTPEARDGEKDETSTKEAEKTSPKEAEETSPKEAEETSTKAAEETSTKEAEETSTKAAEETSTKEAEETSTKAAEETSTKKAQETSTKEAQKTSTKEAEETSTKGKKGTSTNEAEETSTNLAEETSADEWFSTNTPTDFNTENHKGSTSVQDGCHDISTVDVPSGTGISPTFPEITISVKVSSLQTLNIGLSLSNAETTCSLAPTKDKCASNLNLQPNAGNTGEGSSSSGGPVVTDAHQMRGSKLTYEVSKTEAQSEPSLSSNPETFLPTDAFDGQKYPVYKESRTTEQNSQMNINQVLNASSQVKHVTKDERKVVIKGELSKEDGKWVRPNAKTCRYVQFVHSGDRQGSVVDPVSSLEENSEPVYMGMNTGSLSPEQDVFNKEKVNLESHSKKRNPSVHRSLTSSSKLPVPLSDRIKSPDLNKLRSKNIPVLYNRNVSPRCVHYPEPKNFSPALWGLPDDTGEDREFSEAGISADAASRGRMRIRSRHSPIYCGSGTSFQTRADAHKFGRRAENHEALIRKRRSCNRSVRSTAGSRESAPHKHAVEQDREAGACRNNPEIRLLKRKLDRNRPVEADGPRNSQQMEDCLWRNTRRYLIGHIDLLENSRRNVSSRWIGKRSRSLRDFFSRLLPCGRVTGHSSNNTNIVNTTYK